MADSVAGVVGLAKSLHWLCWLVTFVMGQWSMPGQHLCQSIMPSRTREMGQPTTRTHRPSPLARRQPTHAGTCVVRAGELMPLHGALSIFT
jgi:hypothetical protein